MRRTRRLFVRNPIALIATVISIGCLLILILILSVLMLPDISAKRSRTRRTSPLKMEKVTEEGEIETRFAEMMLEMLPEDLAFTVFMPSERAFERDLGLRANGSLGDDKFSDTYAILTRVLGFSAVPRAIYSDSVPIGREICYDSLSGFNLSISKDLNGILMVNGARSKKVDVERGKVVVHVMDGAIMDSAFQHSVQPEENEDDRKINR